MPHMITDTARGAAGYAAVLSSVAAMAAYLRIVKAADRARGRVQQ